MTGSYEKFPECDVTGLDIDAVVFRWPSWDEVEGDTRHITLGPLIDEGISGTREKCVDAVGIRARIEKLARTWP